jgi:predicted transcriptional regulator
MPKILNHVPMIKRSIALEPDEDDVLNEIAREERRSFNSIIRQAVAEFVARWREKREAA